jgi:hypothetical protein
VWYCALLPIIDGLLSTYNNEQEAFDWVSPFIITTTPVSELLQQGLQTSFLGTTTVARRMLFPIITPLPVLSPNFLPSALRQSAV